MQHWKITGAIVRRETRAFTPAVALLAAALAMDNCGLARAAAPAEQKLSELRQRVGHIIVIYQENWSFDGLFGKFPGANGLDRAGQAARQVDRNGVPYALLPQPFNTVTRKLDPRFPADLPVAPFDLMQYMVAPNDKTGDLIHRFYHEQLQIDGGKMDKFVACSDATGLAMSYFDASDMPEGKLAKEFTLCDNFFHAAFGGSFLNHIWFIAAASPKFPHATPNMIAVPPGGPGKFSDAQVTPDGYAVNTVFSVNLPHRRDSQGDDIFAAMAKLPARLAPKQLPTQLLPNQTMPTIGDRLSEKGIDWAWYSGGWDRAMAADPDPEFNELFQFHHQPFVYFANFADGTSAKKVHLLDEKDFEAALARTGDKSPALPAVSFIKPFGIDNEHPGYATLLRGQQHVAHLVDAVRKSRYWSDSLIIITYDENGGRWDHVPPPKKDRWGPGTRVPTIVIGPFARRGHIDHTEYDTTAILKLIERRFDLQPLTDRDRYAGDLLNALEFDSQ
jgi:acid phosphatase